MARMNELRQLTRVRMLLFLREPEAIFWVFVFPVVLALVLGIAFKGRGVEPSAVGVLENQVAPRWIEALDADPLIEVHRFTDPQLAADKLRSGAISILVEGGESQELRVRSDVTRAESETARLRADAALQRAAGRVDAMKIEDLRVTEKGARYIDFLLPGLLGMNLMGTGMWGTGFAIVDWRQKKLLKLFLTTPMRRSSLLAANMLSRMAFLVAEVVVIVCFGAFVLGVPVRGDLLSFGLVCLLGAMGFTGLGLLVASRATTIEGVSGLMNFVMMPMWLLSGVFFSYERYPAMLQPVIKLLPLTALNDALRASMLEGHGLFSFAPQIAVLVATIVLSFAIALRVFRWR